MGEVRVKTVINADTASVWAVLSDVASWSDWNEIMVDGRCDDRSPGARISCKVAVGPIMFPVDSYAHTWQEERALIWGEDRGHVIRVNHGFSLEPTDDGGTHIEHFESFEGVAGRLVFPLIRSSLTRNYAAFLDALKRRVERT